jgi:hypothetical protein
MTAELKQKLDEIVGKIFNYKGKNINIEKYKDVNGTNVVIFADGRPMNFLTNEVEPFLDALLDPLEKEKTETQVMVPKKEMITFEPTKDNTQIKSILMDTLQKIKDDPKYIAQASSICEVVGQMVAIQKNEIQMLGIINKFK